MADRNDYSNIDILMDFGSAVYTVSLESRSGGIPRSVNHCLEDRTVPVRLPPCPSPSPALFTPTDRALRPQWQKLIFIKS